MKNKRLLQRRSIGWFVAVCLLFGIAGNLVSAGAAGNVRLTLMIETKDDESDFGGGSLELILDNSGPQGSYIADGRGVAYSEEISSQDLTVIAHTNEGYEFVEWSANQAGLSEGKQGDNPMATFLLLDEGLTIYAVFEKNEVKDGGPGEETPDGETPSNSGGGNSGPTTSYTLDYLKKLTLSVSSKYPVKDLSLSLAELSEALEIVLIRDTGNSSAEIACEIESSTDYGSALFEESGVYPVPFTVKYSGRSYTGTVELTIVDMTPPDITNAENNSEFYLELENVEAAPKTLAELVELLKVTAVDNYDGPVPMDCEIDGVDFEDIDWTVDGEYDVIFYAEDAAGNTTERIMRIYVSTAAVVPAPPTGGGNPSGGDSSWPPETWEKIPETATLVPKADGSWDVQEPIGNSIGTVTEEDGEWVFIPVDETPTGSFTTLPKTGSMMTNVALLLGLALVLTGGLLRKKSQ